MLLQLRLGNTWYLLFFTGRPRANQRTDVNIRRYVHLCKLFHVLLLANILELWTLSVYRHSRHIMNLCEVNNNLNRYIQILNSTWMCSFIWSLMKHCVHFEQPTVILLKMVVMKKGKSRWAVTHQEHPRGVCWAGSCLPVHTWLYGQIQHQQRWCGGSLMTTEVGLITNNDESIYRLRLQEVWQRSPHTAHHKWCCCGEGQQF